MKKNNTCEIFYLGYCSPMLYKKKWSSEIYKVFYPIKYDKLQVFELNYAKIVINIIQHYKLFN